MRIKRDSQTFLNFTPPSSLKVVQEYRAKYNAIDQILRAIPQLLELAHGDLAQLLSPSSGGRKSVYTSDQVLRALIVMFVEGITYRKVVVQIEESEFLRNFVGLGIRSMMNFTFLCMANGCWRLRVRW